jgi:hypothetical protein
MQSGTRPAAPATGGHSNGDLPQHAVDGGMDRPAQAFELGSWPLRQQDQTDQRGIAGSEHQHDQAERQSFGGCWLTKPMM